MSTTKFYVLLVKDGPLRDCARMFLEDGTPLPGLIAYSVQRRPMSTTRVILEFNDAETIYITEPPPGKSAFYSQTFPPGVKPARVGKYLAEIPGSDDRFMLLWNGMYWCDSRSRRFTHGQPYAWRGLAFDPECSR